MKIIKLKLMQKYIIYFAQKKIKYEKIMDTLEHFWTEHKKAVIVVAIVIVVLLIL